MDSKKGGGLTGISFQLLKAIKEGKCDATTKFLSSIESSEKQQKNVMSQFEYISKEKPAGKHLILWAKDDFKGNSKHVAHLMEFCMNNKVGGRCFKYCGLFGN